MSYQSAFSAAETAEAMYQRECGEMMADTIVDTILDDCPLGCADEQRSVLRTALLAAVNTLTERDIAEWAAKVSGNMCFEDWYGDQQ